MWMCTGCAHPPEELMFQISAVPRLKVMSALSLSKIWPFTVHMPFLRLNAILRVRTTGVFISGNGRKFAGTRLLSTTFLSGLMMNLIS